MRVDRRVLAAVLTGALAAGVVVSGAAPASARPQPLQILVTNDDGVAAPGIAALVTALRKLPNVKVTVVAPSTNQSGTSDKTTPGTLQAIKSTTAGRPSTAVVGFPADSVLYALNTLHLKPGLVVSGINLGQNVGPAVDLSGTVGAARTAARHGIPALAVSQGLAPVPDYATGAREAVKWFVTHRKALAKAKGKKAFVDNLNIPTCAAGTKPRGLVKVPPATSGDILGAQDCSSTATAPTDDIAGLTAGYVTLSPSIPY
jgi:5'-nucleotidase